MSELAELIHRWPRGDKPHDVATVGDRSDAEDGYDEA